MEAPVEQDPVVSNTSLEKRQGRTVTRRITVTRTITRKLTTTRTRTVASTSYPITTITRTRTLKITSTVCAGTNPSPTFKLHFQDTDATDQYNNQYLTYAPYDPDDGYYGDELDGSPTQAGGKVFYEDCVGRITTAGSFGEVEYLAAITGSDIAAVYLFNQAEYLGYDPNNRAYLSCDNVDGFLQCNAGGGLTILQTTQLYEVLGTTVVIGSRVGSNGYFPFMWKVFNV